MFLNLKISNLRNSEFVQFFIDLITIFKKYDPAKLQVEEHYQKLDQENEVLGQVFHPHRGSMITGDIVVEDNRRDSAFKGISAVIDGFTYSFNPVVREAALMLQDSLKNFKGADRLNYSAETSTLNDLVLKWRTEPMAKAIKTLGQSDWLDELEAANNKFNERFLARIEEGADSPNIKMKEQRHKVTIAYAALQKHIEAHATINGMENYQELVNEVNVLVQTYDKILKARKGNSNNTN